VSFQPPMVAIDPADGFGVPDLELGPVTTRESQSFAPFVPSVVDSQPERDSKRSPSGQTPVTALAQFGNGGPRGQGAGNPPGGGGPGNGNQFPGSGNQGGPGGQGAGGVCIATKIQLEAKPTAVLTDYRDNAVLARPAQGSFFSD
jgi:hypothetical protein